MKNTGVAFTISNDKIPVIPRRPSSGDNRTTISLFDILEPVYQFEDGCVNCAGSNRLAYGKDRL